MRVWLLPFAAIWIWSGVACAQAPAPRPAPTPTPSAAPEAPAPRLYQVALLRKGPNWSADDDAETRGLQEGHQATVRRLSEAGQIVASGACGDGDLRGLLLFATASRDEAIPLLEGEPLVTAARLRVDWLTFAGAPGIGRALAEQRRSGTAPAEPELGDYQVALVRLGPRFNANEANENRALFMARNAWMEQLAGRGVLALSGPFVGGGELSGLVVLRAGSLAAAQALLANDPAVKTERFAFELHACRLPKAAVE